MPVLHLDLKEKPGNDGIRIEAAVGRQACRERQGFASRLCSAGARRRPYRHGRQCDVRAGGARRAQEGRHLEDRHRRWRRHRFAGPGSLPQPVHRHRAMGNLVEQPDRDRCQGQRGPRPRRELRAVRRRQEVGVQTEERRHLPQWQDGYRRRCRGLGQASHHRGHEIGREIAAWPRSRTSVADGAETVVFELDGGNADFPYIMSDYSRSCRRKRAASTGSRASAPAPICSRNSSPASSPPSTRTRTTSNPTRAGSTVSNAWRSTM